ncbi:MAG: glycosyltransferase family 4 protein [Candidatus Acidiferrum sp.]
MRLAVVSPFLDRQHGTELCIVEQIERFAQKDRWTIELYSQTVSELSGVCLASQIPEESPGSIVWHRVADIPGPHLVKYVWWFFANHWQRWRDRRSGKVRPDLVYSPGINCLDADLIVVHIVFHAFFDRVKTELALLRNPVLSWPGLIHRKLYYKLIMLLEREIYHNPRTRLIAVSGLVAAQLKAYFRCDEVTVIPNAVDTSRFTPEARTAKRGRSRRALGFPDGDFVVLLIGNDWKKKGLAILLEALAMLKDLPVRALIVGREDPRTYKTLLDDFGLNDRVRFEKPSPDVLSFYAAADLYAAPSLEDAFNLPILEAMACGLPVVASSQAGASEIVHDGKTGFVLRDPRDHAQLADLIRRLFVDESLRNAIGEDAVRDVRANCSWERNAARTREILESLPRRSRN